MFFRPGIAAMMVMKINIRLLNEFSKEKNTILNGMYFSIYF